MPRRPGPPNPPRFAPHPTAPHRAVLAATCSRLHQLLLDPAWCTWSQLHLCLHSLQAAAGVVTWLVRRRHLVHTLYLSVCLAGSASESESWAACYGTVTALAGGALARLTIDARSCNVHLGAWLAMLPALRELEVYSGG